MQRFIHTLALTAALTVLVTGLWNDWGLLAVAKRMAIAYLGFFVLASVAALVVRSVDLFETRTAPKESEPAQAAPKSHPEVVPDAAAGE